MPRPTKSGLDRKRYTTTNLEEVRDAVYELRDGFTIHMLSVFLDVSSSCARKWLYRLLDKGTVQVALEGGGGVPAVYELTPVGTPAEVPSKPAPKKRRYSRHSGSGPSGRSTRVSDKETAAVLADAKASGMTAEKTRNGHFKVMHEGKVVTTLASTPSEYRGNKNAKAAVKRAKRAA